MQDSAPGSDGEHPDNRYETHRDKTRVTDSQHSVSDVIHEGHRQHILHNLN